MFYTIYQTTNIINNKIYIGKHQTNNITDSYLGSGTLLKNAIKKYGVSNFKKEILFVFETEVEMNNKEKELVDKFFTNRIDTYNLCYGGKGGFGFINSRANEEIERKRIIGLSRSLKNKPRNITNETRAQRRLLQLERQKLSNSPEAANKKKATQMMNNHQQGEKNSQFGTCWVVKDNINKKIKIIDLDYYFKLGYVKGRKIKKFDI